MIVSLLMYICAGVCSQTATMSDVVKQFNKVHKRLLRYLKASPLEKHIKFAQIWNEIVDSMRAEASATSGCV